MRQTRHKTSYRRPKSPLVMAVNTALSTFARTNMHSSSSALPLLSGYGSKNRLHKLHQRLVQPLCPCEALPNYATIRASDVNNKDHLPQRSTSFNQCPGNKIKRRFNNHRQLSSSWSQNTKILRFARYALTAAKN